MIEHPSHAADPASDHAPAPTPPPAPAAAPVRTIRHGVTLTDEFAWLRDPNWQHVMHDPGVLDPAIRKHLDAENAYAGAMLASTVPLQETLIAEMRSRIKEDDATVPSPDGPFSYFYRYCEGGQHPSIWREPRGGAREILLDGDQLAAGKAFFRLGETVHSPDHKLLAWSADENGSELFPIRVRDLARMKELPDIVPQTTSEVAWTRDSAAFYYVRRDAQQRPSSVHRHRLGAGAAEDADIYAAPPDGRLMVSLDRLRSGRFAAISASDHDTSETWLVDLEDPDATATLVAPREPGLLYDVAHHPDFNGGAALLIRTNADGAEDFKIVWTPLATPSRAHWRDLVPHRQGVFMLSFTVLQDWLVRLEREDGLPRIVYRRIGSDDEHTVAFDEEAYSLWLHGGYEFATSVLRFSYSSMATPREVWDYDLAAGTRTLGKRDEIPSGHDPAAYVTRRVSAPAADGETVPVSLLYRKATPIDGTAPLFVYGYGSYGASMSADFDSDRFSLVDRGFVYAIAHVRGGTEKGWRWYREGKLAAKSNTFSDFIAATDHLVKTGFGAPGKVVAEGRSAGGLVMGAVANLRPDLYTAMIAVVPFVDALNTILDDTLPLTPPEWVEWGNPVTDPAAFETIRSYSPYENVRVQNYPAMLVLAGLTDPRVTYWEPAKWVARLRARKTDRNPIVLCTNMDAGHGGAPGRFDRLKEIALSYAFAMAAVDKKLPKT